MRVLQRVSALFAWIAIIVAGVLLIAESTGSVTDSWRAGLGDGVAWLANPGVEPWLAALLGAGAALVGVMVTLSQVTPLRRTVRSMTIDQTGDGSTEISSSTVYRRISHDLSGIEGVYGVKPIPNSRRLMFRVELIDTGNVEAVMVAARSALEEGIWSSLGLTALPVDLMLTYRKSASPVSRKEQLI